LYGPLEQPGGIETGQYLQAVDEPAESQLAYQVDAVMPVESSHFNKGMPMRAVVLPKKGK
jgi:hypothetical protein